MKLIYTSFCLFFFLNTQAQLQFHSEADMPETNADNTFTDIPLRPQSKSVDVFLTGEKPKQEYYKVRILEVSGASNSNSLLASLKQQAQQLGFDGVIILGKNDYTYQDNGVGSAITYGLVSGMFGNKNPHYHAPVLNGETLTAVAIKYKANLGYVQKIIKHVSVRLNDTLHTVYDLSFFMNSSFAKGNRSDATDFYLRNISLFQFADFFTNYHASGMNDGNPNYNLLTAKLETDTGNVKYEASYLNDSLVYSVTIKMPKNGEIRSLKQYDVVFDLDAGQIQKRYIRQGRKKDWIFTDVYSYDAAKRCTGFVRTNTKTNKEIFSVKYDFFTEDDLPEASK